jgi:L-aminopeptidase/D-esterase-like protein
MTNARCTKVGVNRIAQRSHDGMARAIKPVHTSFDGDIVFVLSAGDVDVSFEFLAAMASETTALAIRSGVRNASSLGGVPALNHHS